MSLDPALIVPMPNAHRTSQTISPGSAIHLYSLHALVLRRHPRLPLLTALFLSGMVACAHDAPFEPVDPPDLGPFSTLTPRRITFNRGDDRTPAWLPDGSGILYSTEREDRLDHDRCLAVLPPDGGTVSFRRCPVEPVQDDSTNLMDAAAVSPDGRVLFHQVTSWIGQQKLGEASIEIGNLADPVNSSRLTLLPYTAANGRIHSSIRSPAWTGPSTVVYLAELLFYQGSTFYPDTFVTGLDIVQVDLDGPAPLYQLIPGTDYASSVAVSSEPGVIYYTLGGDSKVYRRDLAAGTVSVTHDFGTGLIVRDASVFGSRLVAVVAGSVLYQFEAAHNGFVQRDEGGDLHFVDLATGNTSVVASDTVLFRHPVFSPDGQRVVVEVTPFAPVHVGPDSEYNATNHRADLWLFDLR